MNFLYISPEFPPNYANFIYALQAAGARVWGMGEADFYEMPESLRAALPWYVRTDLHSPDRVIHALEQLQQAQARLGVAAGFDLVESHNEAWLRLEALINEKLGLDGLHPAGVDRIKLKSAMKAIFAAAGLPVAGAARITNPADALKLAHELGYPLILKPDEGVGAVGMQRVNDPLELSRQLARLPPDYITKYLLEQWIDAPIVSYDGLADAEGRVLFASSLVYGSGVLECVQGQDTFFYIHREVPEDLADIGPQLVKAFGLRRKFFHFEFFRRPDGCWPIEINARPPGGAILDMMNYSADIDLYTAYARMAVCGQTAITCGPRRFTAYVGRRSRAYALSSAAVREALGTALVDEGANPPLFTSAMGLYRFIFRTDTEEELLGLARLILAAA